MLCTNGHNNLASAQKCSFCGVDTFQQSTQLLAAPTDAVYNGAAIASLVLGILWLLWIGSLLALIFGFMALKQIERRQEQGRALAIAGLTLGFVGVGTWILVMLFLGQAALRL